ncbi:MAG TPA: outer membrane beta-barrel protein [Pyrinomonadaceae bacterium]|nr:outer membrane beta-barrel protein [Pyrinomonadaceae bacterium]
MRKLMILAVLVVASASMAFAQSTDYNKVEVSAGYSHARVDTGVEDPDLEDDVADFLADRRGFNGFDASITGNLTRYFGLKGNISGHFKSDSFTDGIDTVNTRERMWNFLGGVQIKDNSKEKTVKPFAHVLAGVARQEVRFTSPSFADVFDIEDTNFAMKFGAGLDVRVHPRVDLRVIEFNYNPIFRGDVTLDDEVFTGRTQHNFTIGFGIAIH